MNRWQYYKNDDYVGELCPDCYPERRSELRIIRKGSKSKFYLYCPCGFMESAAAWGDDEYLHLEKFIPEILPKSYHPSDEEELFHWDEVEIEEEINDFKERKECKDLLDSLLT